MFWDNFKLFSQVQFKQDGHWTREFQFPQNLGRFNLSEAKKLFLKTLFSLFFLSTKPWPVEIYLNLSEPKIVFLETSFPPSFDPWNAFPSFHFPSANIELKSNEDFHGLCRLQSCIAVFGKGNFLHSKIIPTISTHYFHIFLFTLLFPQFIPVHEVHRFPLHNQRMNPRKISSYWEYPTFWPQFTLVVMSKTFNISYF